MGNMGLTRAAKARDDEFYTQRADIEKELSHYHNDFKNKTVYCNCDDPLESEFVKFFLRNFSNLGVRRLIATHYAEADMFDSTPSYYIDVTPDQHGKIPVEPQSLKQLPLSGNGDFRSEECLSLLNEADMVVTNPPFSLFRDYIALLVSSGKQFLIIGNDMAATYKDVFSLILENKLWKGYYSGDMSFRVPDSYTAHNESDTRFWIDAEGKKWRSLGNVCWFTNIDIRKRHSSLDLRGNYYDPITYKKYDGYDAINVEEVDRIPIDYAGLMGVPPTFLNKFNPEQFQLIGLDRYVSDNPHPGRRFTIDGKEKFARIIIRNLSPRRH
ncbi:MAG: adenine-specific methyltransferase EcoRI family protein [Bifidobacterium sp.]|jgi:hypothetical protein